MATVSKTRPEMHVVLSDQHIPFQDPVIERLSLEFLRDQQPDVIHLLGDIMDFYTLSRFDKDPTRILSLAEDIDNGLSYFTLLRDACPRAIIKYSEGNHESRLQRYLWSKAPELSSLPALQMPELLRLKDFDISWVSARKPYKHGRLLYTHGDIVRRWSGASAKAHYEKFGCSVIHGHTHRQGSFFTRSYSDTYAAFENGCLCTLEPEYMVSPDWQNGWSVVWYAPNGNFQVEQVSVFDNAYTFHGEFRT